MTLASSLTRRSFLGASAVLPFASLPLRGSSSTPKVVVIGAGAFGGWTALALTRAGARVTLVDGWGPGNSRASSGGETRVIRGIYGGDPIYTEWVARSFPIWSAAQEAAGRRLYHRTGALWMFQGDDSYAVRALASMEKNRLAVESWSREEAARRYPQIELDGIESIYFEPEAGYLTARDACAAVRDLAIDGGASWQMHHARPGRIENEIMPSIDLGNQTELGADAFVFACGPWLSSLFPDLLGEAITPTRQEVFYFGTPAGSSSWNEEEFPVWVDFGEQIFYGIPGNRWRGFKIADDTRGEPIDPTTMDRKPTPAKIELAREYLSQRFPALAGGPLLESRVCQYENSPDGDFIIDRHPGAKNVWIVGGGSGHGFKLAPALGEHVASLMLGESDPMPKFGLARFASARDRHTQFGEGRW